MQKIKLKIDNIKCESCVLLIEGRLKEKEGVLKFNANKDSGNAIIFFDEGKISQKDILEEIEAINNFKATAFDGNTDNLPADSFVVKKEPQKKASSFPRPLAIVIASALIMLAFFAFSRDNKTIITDKDPEVQDQQALAPVANRQPEPAEITKSDKPILEAYIVSNCPFGLQMQRVLADVIKNVPSAEENIKVRYMGSVSGGQITSMHGDKEAQENLKQICIREEQENKYWDYVSCYMKKGDTQGCLSSAGINTAKLDSCVSDPKKGLEYAKEDFVLNGKYSIKGSPTLIMAGSQVSEFSFGGRTSDALKTVICNGFNKQPGFCSAKLNTASAKASFSETY